MGGASGCGRGFLTQASDGCRPVEVEPELDMAVAMGTEPDVLVSGWGLVSYWLLASIAGFLIG